MRIGKGEGVLVRRDGSWVIRVDPRQKIHFKLGDAAPGHYWLLDGWTWTRREDGTTEFVPGTIRQVPESEVGDDDTFLGYTGGDEA